MCGQEADAYSQGSHLEERGAGTVEKRCQGVRVVEQAETPECRPVSWRSF